MNAHQHGYVLRTSSSSLHRALHAVVGAVSAIECRIGAVWRRWGGRRTRYTTYVGLEHLGVATLRDIGAPEWMIQVARERDAALGAFELFRGR